MGKLILIRHGHTPLNGHGSEERLRSWLDIPLDEEGLQEAAETADKIAGYPVSAIFSSDLRRARQTAEVLRQKTTGAIITTDELRPWNLGVFGGQLLREIIPFLNLMNERPTCRPQAESLSISSIRAIPAGSSKCYCWPRIRPVASSRSLMCGTFSPPNA